MSRLCQEQVDGDVLAGPVVWCLEGRLEPQSVQAQRSFRFVADEATAAALDDEAEEDILVVSRDFDALALVEDELILSLPLVPLHEVCPEALPMSAVDPEFEQAAERPNPFGRGMHRSHNALNVPGIAVEPTTGETHLRHHISPNGFYRGRQVLKNKSEA
eukprot:gene4907-4806_t